MRRPHSLARLSLLPGRVGDWRGSARLGGVAVVRRLSPYAGASFPAVRPVSSHRSSNRTCRFPASGFLPARQTFALDRSTRRLGTPLKPGVDRHASGLWLNPVLRCPVRRGDQPQEGSGEVVPHTELLPQPFQPASGWFSLSFRLRRGLDLLSLSSGVGRLIVNHRGCRSFPRLDRVRAPSLRWHYPASSVLRTHPPSASAGAGPHGFAVDAEVPPPHHDRRLPLLRTAHVPCVLPSLPRWDRRLRISLASPATAAFPDIMAGRLPH